MPLKLSAPTDPFRPGRARAAVALVLVACAVVLGACDGSDKVAYKRDAKAIIDPLRATLDGTKERVSAATSGRAKIAALGKTRRAVEKAATELEQLTPPDGAQAAHDNFVKRLHVFADDIKAVETATRDFDRAAAATALGRLRVDTRRLEAANAALKAKVD